MISITDNYLPKFQKLVNRVQALQPTTPEYLTAKDLYVKSLESEIAIRALTSFTGLPVICAGTDIDLI